MPPTTTHHPIHAKTLRQRGSVRATLSVLMASIFLTQGVAFSDPLIRVQSPETVAGCQCPVCPACPVPLDPELKTSIIDFSCRNPSVKQSVQGDVEACLGCSSQLEEQARKCGMIDTCSSCCPKCELPENGCRITSCPAGQSLWDRTSPNCSCKPNKNVCDDLGGEITKVGVVRKHWDYNYPEKIRAFTWAQSGAAISSIQALDSDSKCLSKAYRSCWDNFRTQFPLGPNALMYSYRENATLRYVDTCISNSLELAGDITIVHTKGKGKGYNEWSGSNYLDANCRPIPSWQKELITQAQCDNIREINFNELTSPVSLVWANDVLLKDVNSRTRFPLNPEQAGHWFAWRGSGLTPLVVWDPEESGYITKAAQLFGNHTWGKSWKNGYEALASIDKDTNGWLEHGELKNISLWFDFNQDGVSDKGEVKSLRSVGVEAIGVTISQDNSKGGLILAEKGFRRRIGKEVFEGRSVDWFGAVVDDRLGSETLYPQVPPVSTDFSATKELEKTVSGFWKWRAVDFSGHELPENLPSGSFILYKEDGNIGGTAYVSNRLAPNNRGLSETVDATRLEGTTFQSNQGKTRVTFSTKTAYGGIVKTEAELSGDGETLSGVTVEELGPNKDKTTYAWIAQRRIE